MPNLFFSAPGKNLQDTWQLEDVIWQVRGGIILG